MVECRNSKLTCINYHLKLCFYTVQANIHQCSDSNDLFGSIVIFPYRWLRSGLNVLIPDRVIYGITTAWLYYPIVRGLPDFAESLFLSIWSGLDRANLLSVLEGNVNTKRPANSHYSHLQFAAKGGLAAELHTQKWIPGKNSPLRTNTYANEAQTQ